ncbi:MAG: collagen-like triple helix repeat-containing protein [Sporichthyaceae bacterium]
MTSLDSGRARRLAFAVVPLAAVALLVPGVALASGSATTTSGTLAGCLKADGSLVKVAKGAKPAASCKKAKGTKVVWNVKGPKGAKGAKGEKGDPGLAGVAGLQGLIGPAGPTGASGVSGLETVTKTVGDGGGLPLGAGGLTSPVAIACPAGKMALSGGVIPSDESLLDVGGLLGLLPGDLLANVTSIVSSGPAGVGDAWELVSALPANPGDTFYALCVTALP